MRTIKQLLRLSSSRDMTEEESLMFGEWLDQYARYKYDSYQYCKLLGWYVLDQRIPLSPKEAGFE